MLARLQSATVNAERARCLPGVCPLLGAVSTVSEGCVSPASALAQMEGLHGPQAPSCQLREAPPLDGWLVEPRPEGSVFYPDVQAASFRLKGLPRGLSRNLPPSIGNQVLGGLFPDQNAPESQVTGQHGLLSAGRASSCCQVR